MLKKSSRLTKIDFCLHQLVSLFNCWTKKWSEGVTTMFFIVLHLYKSVGINSLHL